MFHQLSTVFTLPKMGQLIHVDVDTQSSWGTPLGPTCWSSVAIKQEPQPTAMMRKQSTLIYQSLAVGHRYFVMTEEYYETHSQLIGQAELGAIHPRRLLGGYGICLSYSVSKRVRGIFRKYVAYYIPDLMTCTYTLRTFLEPARLTPVAGLNTTTISALPGSAI